MSCYHPRIAVDTGKLTARGKPEYRLLGYKEWQEMKSLYIDKAFGKAIEIPCGKCLGCRLTYAKRWADRCMLEAQYHEYNWFCTFTYNDASVPVLYDNIDFLTGEILGSRPEGVESLRYKDFQDFLKRLRKAGYKFRYFCCSEYGDKTMRPHYHCIFFGLDLTSADLQDYKTVAGYEYYISPTLEKIWNNGFVVVSPLTYATAAYTARYVMKKAQKDIDYEYLGVEPERTYMSRRPGIGHQWYVDHDMYEYDYFTLGGDDGSHRIYPSRYYDKLLEEDDPERYAEIKKKRLERSREKVEMKLSQSDYDYLEMLAVEEDVLLSRMSGLSRDRIDSEVR